MSAAHLDYGARGPYAVRELRLAPRLPDHGAPHAVDAWLPEAVTALRGLVLFSHGFGGHRRQSTFVLDHLASHGYAVLSVDHVGPQLPAIMAKAMGARARGEAVGPATLFEALPSTRPRELLALLPQLRDELHALHARSPELPAPRGEPWAVVGHSFGAYTGLVAAARTDEIRALIALAPAGGPGPVYVPDFGRELALERLTHVDTLFIAAEHDSLVPLAGVEALYEACAGESRLVVLEGADHVHFCDHVPESHAFLLAATRMPELRGHLPLARDYGALLVEEAAHKAIRALVTAQLEASFHDELAARAALAAPAPPSRLLRQKRGSAPTP